MARRTNTRRNPESELFQEIFDLDSPIQRDNRIQRLVQIFSFAFEGVVSISDIF